MDKKLGCFLLEALNDGFSYYDVVKEEAVGGPDLSRQEDDRIRRIRDMLPPVAPGVVCRCSEPVRCPKHGF